MEKGTKIIIAEWSNEYGGVYRGYTGTVEGHYNSEKYMVELDELRNDQSKYGYFYRDSIIPMNTSKVLVGDLNTGYSFVDHEKAEELRIRKEIASQCKRMLNSIYGVPSIIPFERPKIEIEKVIFNNPATIVMWSDGEKTIVKCSCDEAFDEEKGLAMAISKRVLGNKGNYYNEFKKWLPEIEEGENV